MQWYKTRFTISYSLSNIHHYHFDFMRSFFFAFTCMRQGNADCDGWKWKLTLSTHFIAFPALRLIINYNFVLLSVNKDREKHFDVIQNMTLLGILEHFFSGKQFWLALATLKLVCSKAATCSKECMINSFWSTYKSANGRLSS